MSDSTQHLLGMRYEVGQLLGQGSLTQVHAGRDIRLGRDVAIKRLLPKHADDSTYQARFRRMAQVTASLNHPTFMATYDTGEEEWDGVLVAYVVMERVAGRTLRDILREGRMILPERALEMIAGILSGLDYAHRVGILHNNISPANVMLTPSGDIKIGGLGFARSIAEAPPPDAQNSIFVGTVQYASPEQLRGEVGDSRSDVYSAGCVLYELLTGRPPFVGDSPVAVAYQHVREAPAPPSDLDDHLSPEVDSIVMKALAKSVDDRYQSAAAFKADIERYLAGHPIQASPFNAQPVPDELPPIPLSDEVTRETSHALSPYDVVPDVDGIGRGPLVEHLRELMLRLVGGDKAPGEPSSRVAPAQPATFVIGIDAPWGSGKTTLTSLLLARLAADDGPVGNPVVVSFDAWRQERIGPEWWALGSHLYRGIRAERAISSRLAMTAWTAIVRLFRSKIFVSAVIILFVSAAVLGSSGLTAVAARWQEVAAFLAVALTGALGLSRLLFWSSPAIGAIYQRSDDAPLTEISEMVARLRRWSPRSSTRQALAENLAGLWCLLTVAGAVLALWVDPELYDPGGQRLWLYFSACALTAVALRALTHQRGSQLRAPSATDRLERWRSAARKSAWPAVAIGLTLSLTVAFAWLSRTSDEWRTRLLLTLDSGTDLIDEIEAVPMVAATAGLLMVFAAYVDFLSSAPKRPVLLVIDDLDRCTDGKTVAYLETVHTLMRHQDSPRWMSEWRRPAALFVLVLADGRWIRQSFAKAYDTFETLSADETRGLGADFVQKLFDHTVMVPELSVEQSHEYLRVLTASDVSASPASREARLDPITMATTENIAENIVRATSPADLDQLERDTEVTPSEASAVRAAVSDRRSTDDYVRELTSHLMTRYADQMPRNPRLIKRVANAWSMLQALQLSIGRVKTEQDLVSAAIVMTTFPTLLDSLLHAPMPPADTGVWRRADVEEVRRLGRDECPSLRDLGECFGKFFPEPRSPTFAGTTVQTAAAADSAD